MRSAATATRTSTKKARNAALRHTMAPTNNSAMPTPSCECIKKALANSATTTRATSKAAMVASEMATLM
jgi:hypothetical protein